MKTEFPFGEFDFRKYMGDFKLTGMDSKGMMEQQKRNIEAIQEANQQAMQNMQKIMQKDAAVFRTQESLESGRRNIDECVETYTDVGIQDKGLVWNTDLIEAMELENLLVRVCAVGCVPFLGYSFVHSHAHSYAHSHVRTRVLHTRRSTRP